MARSSATQHMSLEYRKSRGWPRISQMPWSFSVQAARGGVRRGGQELLCYRVQLAQPIDQPLCGVEQFAVYIELALGPRAISDADWPAVPPPGQVRQFPLGQVSLAADPEHDLQVRAPPQLGGRRVG